MRHHDFLSSYRFVCRWVLSVGLSAACMAAFAAEPLILKADEPIYVVAHSAVDCPVCKTWRESTTGLPYAKSLSKTWPKVRFVLIERRYLNGSEDESLYPKALHAQYLDRKNRYQMSPATPLFEIVVRDRVVLRLAGLQAWDDEVIPAVRELEKNRETGS